MILEVDKVNSYYGKSHILFDVSLCVAEKEAVCILGRNGAGKTTTLRTIMGLTACRSGSIKYEGRAIERLAAHRIAKMGLGFVPQDRMIFPDLTVEENLKVAQKPPIFRNESWTLEKIYQLFPSLGRRARNQGGYLSGGEQQMLAVGRTLMGNPTMLLLDEVTEGLSPIVVEVLEEKMFELKNMGITILFAEQNFDLALRLSERLYVLDKGKIRFEGTGIELEKNEDVKNAHLLV
jgi:branched-chain amino acid transport system ATP-binding protein